MRYILKKALLIILPLTMIFLNFSCKKECKVVCGENAVCDRGDCECVSSDMIKVGNLSGGGSNLTGVYCQNLEVEGNVFTYQSMNSDCVCAKDIYLFFVCSPGHVGGLIAPCRVHVLFKDNERDIYRSDEWDIDGFFPSGTGEPEPGVPEVFVEYGAGRGTQLSFCRGLPNIDGVAFEGKASADLDTLYLKVEYLDYVNQLVRDTCEMKMLRAGKK